MKTVKKKPHQPHEKFNDEFVKKPAKKSAIKRDKKLSIYDPMDEEEPFDDFDTLLGDDLDESEDDDF
ncbi:MAG: hypothetical protein Q8S18_04585 [Bacteroidales bacterium]|nr:hypothetical protein [Bacteroidales bacterium]